MWRIPRAVVLAKGGIFYIYIKVWSHLPKVSIFVGCEVDVD